MITMEEIKNWEPLSKMENASNEEYAYRINGAYEVELPHKELKLIPYVGENSVVDYNSKELIALCPVTFLPDLYEINIRYTPDEFVPELKALKFYLMDYINLPISHEHLASKIYRDIRDQVKPLRMSIHLDTAIRGGIRTRVKVGDGV